MPSSNSHDERLARLERRLTELENMLAPLRDTPQPIDRAAGRRQFIMQVCLLLVFFGMLISALAMLQGR
jgi:hypothetical protein